ncbi:hypothetical protein EcWSU1_04271 [Enterobacter ludwigii]|uniref:Uncharacterized protein n=1 Tax=Enterobacter ludwigii TaxID=299767 RepID=G8LJ71_9ENTR|nr:hypothetical protein EcWSU1_04271 [Enterobacter ludwigii]
MAFVIGQAGGRQCVVGKDDIGTIALLIVEANRLKVGRAAQIEGGENFVQRCRCGGQHQRPAAFAEIAKIDAEVLFQHLAVGLEQRPQQVVELEHLRVIVGGNGLRRLAVDRLDHPFIIQQQRHGERRFLIPQQAAVACDQHFALRAQRLRQILNRPDLFEMRAHDRLPGKPLLQLIQRHGAHQRADHQCQHRQPSHGVTPIRSNNIAGLTKHISRLASSTATWMV